VIERKQFRISIDPDEIRHTITVLVFKTRDDLGSYLVGVDPAHDWNALPADVKGIQNFGLSGAFWADNFNLGDAGHSGTIALNETDLNLEVITHEVAHAAQHIYAMRFATHHGLVMRHMHGSNERFAYLMGFLTQRIARRLQDSGYRISA
jgi:hypothetical protein